MPKYKPLGASAIVDKKASDVVDNSENRFESFKKVQKNSLFPSSSLDIKDKNRRKFTKEDVIAAIDNGNLEACREISRYFFKVGGPYKRIVMYLANMYLYYYMVLPTADFKATKKAGKERLDGVINWLDKINLSAICQNFISHVLLDGVYYGVVNHIDIDGPLNIQQLPPKWCRSRVKISNYPLVEFNLRFFDYYTTQNKDMDKTTVFSFFPDYLVKGYVDWKEGIENSATSYDVTGNPWYSIPVTDGICFYLTDDLTPLFVSVILENINLQEAREVDIEKDLQELSKILVQQFPVNSDGTLAISPEEIMTFHSMAGKMLQDSLGVDVFTTLGKTELLNVQPKETVSNDKLQKYERAVFYEAGVSALLFSSSTNSALEFSIKNDESTLGKIMSQIQTWLNILITDKLQVKEAKVLLPPVTRYNQDEMIDRYVGLAQYGYSKLLPAIIGGIKQSEFVALIEYEKELGLQELLVPLASSYTGGGESGDEGGRPEKKTKSDKRISNIDKEGGAEA